MRPVHKEIKAMNHHLKSLGAGDGTRIGTMSLSQVAALAVTGYPGIAPGSVDFSSLHALIPFLEAHANQEYLVRCITSAFMIFISFFFSEESNLVSSCSIRTEGFGNVVI